MHRTRSGGRGSSAAAHRAAARAVAARDRAPSWGRWAGRGGGVGPRGGGCRARGGRRRAPRGRWSRCGRAGLVRRCDRRLGVVRESVGVGGDLAQPAGDRGLEVAGDAHPLRLGGVARVALAVAGQPRRGPRQGALQERLPAHPPPHEQRQRDGDDREQGLGNVVDRRVRRDADAAQHDHAGRRGGQPAAVATCRPAGRARSQARSPASPSARRGSPRAAPARSGRA